MEGEVSSITTSEVKDHSFPTTGVKILHKDKGKHGKILKRPGVFCKEVWKESSTRVLIA